MSNNNETIATLVRVGMQLNRSIPIPLLIFGTIGNSLNIFILTRRSLRNNSCAFYFRSSTIANLVCLWCGLLTRLLSGYNLDPTTTNTIICKIRFFITYKALALSSCFLVYASVDRWASSNADFQTRRFSRIHIARRMVAYTTLVSFLFYAQAFYCYSPAIDQYPVACNCPNIICRTYNDLLFLVLYAFIPPMFMLGFGWITIGNIKKTRQQMNSLHQQQRRMKLRKKDTQMITMLLVQVIFFFVCVTPSAVSKAYTTLTLNQGKDALEIAKENFFFQVAALLLYVNCCCAFYIYTMTGRVFRREVKLFFWQISQMTFKLRPIGNTNQIAPIQPPEQREPSTIHELQHRYPF